jgi:hypothetical protein
MHFLRHWAYIVHTKYGGKHDKKALRRYATKFNPQLADRNLCWRSITCVLSVPCIVRKAHASHQHESYVGGPLTTSGAAVSKKSEDYMSHLNMIHILVLRLHAVPQRQHYLINPTNSNILFFESSGITGLIIVRVFTAPVFARQ